MKISRVFFLFGQSHSLFQLNPLDLTIIIRMMMIILLYMNNFSGWENVMLPVSLLTHALSLSLFHLESGGGSDSMKAMDGTRYAY